MRSSPRVLQSSTRSSSDEISAGPSGSRLCLRSSDDCGPQTDLRGGRAQAWRRLRRCSTSTKHRDGTLDFLQLLAGILSLTQLPNSRAGDNVVRNIGPHGTSYIAMTTLSSSEDEQLVALRSGVRVRGGNQKSAIAPGREGSAEQVDPPGWPVRLHNLSDGYR